MLRVVERFVSVQGETSLVGVRCAFVRLAGCNLRCAWCDTQYALTENGWACSVAEVVAWVQDRGVVHTVVTGGEPLLQDETPELCEALCAAGQTVQVETNGSRDITSIRPPARRIVDCKMPSSGMAEAMAWGNLQSLRSGDELKFILANREDYDRALTILSRHDLPEGVTVLFGPVAGRLAARVLAEWILADRVNVRLQIQLQRLLWPESERGV